MEKFIFSFKSDGPSDRVLNIAVYAESSDAARGEALDYMRGFNGNWSLTEYDPSVGTWTTLVANPVAASKRVAEIEGEIKSLWLEIRRLESEKKVISRGMYPHSDGKDYRAFGGVIWQFDHEDGTAEVLSIDA